MNFNNVSYSFFLAVTAIRVLSTLNSEKEHLVNLQQTPSPAHLTTGPGKDWSQGIGIFDNLKQWVLK
jgi:hypothetical protein